MEKLKVVDLGDAKVVSGDFETSYPAIEAAMEVALSGKAVPITLGGDGAIALPQMRALGVPEADVVALHLDAHTDAYPLDGYNNATPFARAFEEGVLNAGRSFHIGTRRSHMVEGVYSYGRQLGYKIINMEELAARGIGDVFRDVREAIGDRPVYLCFDMDFFDPSVAPGVCTPAWGGATTREGLAALKAAGSLNIVAADVNTISPPHDPGGMSAFLAATVVYEMLVMMAAKDIRPG